MGYKTRTNYMPGYKLTQDQYDKIFKKGKYSTINNEEKDKDSTKNLEDDNERR